MVSRNFIRSLFAFNLKVKVMKQITFTITEEEVRSYSEEKLSNKQTRKILDIIENDGVLWNDIEEAIRAAIDVAQNPEA